MNAERARAYLLRLSHVVEKAQFGGIIFCVGELPLGGKMMAMVNPDAANGPPMSFAAGAERMAELLELDGMGPAKYLARVFWVSAERWDVLRDREWEAEMRAAHALTLSKLTPKTRKLLALPSAERRAQAAERERLQAERKASRATKR